MIRKSSRFIAGALVCLGAGWFALRVLPTIRLQGYKPLPVIPGKINLVAVQRGAGYRIVVSNGIAHLVEAGGSSEGFAEDMERSDTHDAARLPIRETLQSLQGDPEELGKLVMSVDKMSEDDLPPQQVVWTAENLKRALDGDPDLVKKLEANLNTKLDGTPLDTINLDAILNGIVIDSPIEVKVPMEGKLKPVVCRTKEFYQTLFAGNIQKVVDDRFNLTREALIGFYREKANQVLKGRKEDVRGNLLSRIDPAKLRERASAPEKILANMTVLINEDHMTGASFVTYPGPNRSILSTVTLKLTEEGRMRLWKYSHENPGFQLLLTVNGVAIAAPRITTDLAELEVKLTRIPSKDQVQDAVEAINKTAKNK